MDSHFTRPVRAAAQIRGSSEGAVEHLFRSARVAVRLEERFAESHDARETFLLAVDQCLRFCPNVCVQLPRGATDLVEQFNKLKSAIYGDDCTAGTDDRTDFGNANAIINIGTEVLSGRPSTTVNSSGWVARVSGATSGHRLSWNSATPNVLGAYAAACLGTSQAFLRLLDEPVFPNAFEVSLFNYEIAEPGSMGSGPPLPREPITIDAWLIGCGGVSNGWAYAIKQLPVKGSLMAVDRELLRTENLGPYVAANRDHIGKPKVDLISELLRPSIRVTPFLDEWEFFKIRLEHGLSVPPLVVAGVDNVETRHSVQRVWPRHLIDMGASALTSQVLVKSLGTEGLCLLGALSRKPNELSYSQRISRQTGLQIDRIVSAPTEPINEDDVAAAPAEMRDELELARQKGQLMCGYILGYLGSEESDIDFAPAVPFVTSFSGIVGAAETMKWLMQLTHSESLHLQYSFQSGRLRSSQMECAVDCECQKSWRGDPASRLSPQSELKALRG
jgi:tRNA A37 threonylcarbamoyladenosine dehydratase